MSKIKYRVQFIYNFFPIDADIEINPEDQEKFENFLREKELDTFNHVFGGDIEY